MELHGFENQPFLQANEHIPCPYQWYGHGICSVIFVMVTLERIACKDEAILSNVKVSRHSHISMIGI